MENPADTDALSTQSFVLLASQEQASNFRRGLLRGDRKGGRQALASQLPGSLKTFLNACANALGT